jgi:hypothetical protein
LPITKIDIITNKRANTLEALRIYVGVIVENEVKILLEKIFKVFIINQLIK